LARTPSRRFLRKITWEVTFDIWFAWKNAITHNWQLGFLSLKIVQNSNGAEKCDYILIPHHLYFYVIVFYTPLENFCNFIFWLLMIFLLTIFLISNLVLLL
jgi:hypothetical protein